MKKSQNYYKRGRVTVNAEVFTRHHDKCGSLPVITAELIFLLIYQRYSQGKTEVYSIQYKNGCLTASDVFHMFSESVMFIIHSIITY